MRRQGVEEKTSVRVGRAVRLDGGHLLQISTVPHVLPDDRVEPVILRTLLQELPRVLVVQRHPRPPERRARRRPALHLRGREHRAPALLAALKKEEKIHGSWGKCLRAGFRTPVEGKRDRWAD